MCGPAISPPLTWRRKSKISRGCTAVAQGGAACFYIRALFVADTGHKSFIAAFQIAAPRVGTAVEEEVHMDVGETKTKVADGDIGCSIGVFPWSGRSVGQVQDI